MAEGEWIDLVRWKRREHYRLFRSYQHPFFSVTAAVDVTRVWHRSRASGGPSFFLTTLFLMLNAANGVEAFRLRLRPRGVWRHDRVAVGPTIPRTDGTFGFARLEAADDLASFLAKGKAAVTTAATRRTLAPGNTADDIIHHSTLPWLHFTSFTNAMPGHSDSIPRIVFGACQTMNKRTTMPVAVEVHHALVDGIDVARFFERFSESCAFARKRE